MDWQLTTATPPVTTLFRAFVRGDKIQPADVDAARVRAEEVWKILDAHLAGNTYVAGNELTVGDIALGNAIHRWYRFPIQRPHYASLLAWYDALGRSGAYNEHVLNPSSGNG